MSRNESQPGDATLRDDGLKRDAAPVPPWVARFFIAAALFYVVVAVTAVIVVSPRVPFADAWLHYASLLDTSFPASVFEAQNGHAEVFANLVRLASLRWLHGDENVQIAVGLGLALAVLALLLHIVVRTQDLTPTARAAAVFVLSLGVFWLGNARALLHDNESLHVYSVLVCLAAAVSIALGKSMSLRKIVAATGLGCAASFTFGSGIAAFVSLFALGYVMRAPVRHYLVVAVGLMVTLVTYRLLPDSSGVPLTLHPLPQAALAARWLATPLIYLAWPMVDPAAATALPSPLHALGFIAQAWTDVFGDIHRSIGPQLVAGLALILLLIRATCRARRHMERTNDVVRLGIALGWFGVAVAGLVALTRFGYFAEHPEQIHAPRYMPWSTLAWAGVLTSMVADAAARRATLAITAVIAVLALAAEVGMTKVMLHERAFANDTALAAVVGVWPDDGGFGETDPDAVHAGALALHRAVAGPFAWPEAVLLGQDLDPGEQPVVVRRMTTNRPHNRINTVGLRLDAILASPRCHSRRLLVANDHRIVGLLRHIDGDHWRGAAAIDAAPASLHVFEPGCR